MGEVRLLRARELAEVRFEEELEEAYERARRAGLPEVEAWAAAVEWVGDRVMEVAELQGADEEALEELLEVIFDLSDRVVEAGSAEEARERARAAVERLELMLAEALEELVLDLARGR